MSGRTIVLALGIVIASGAIAGAQLPVSPDTPAGSGSGVCGVVGPAFEKGTEAALLSTLSAERVVGKYRVGAPCSGSHCVTPEAWLEFGPRDQDWDVSRVDIDGDGVEDLRFTTVVGSAQCESSYFFRSVPGGRHELLGGPAWEQFRQEAAMCRQSLHVVGSRARELLVSRSGLTRRVASAISVFGLPALTPTLSCVLERQSGPLRVVSTCPHALCRILSREIKAGRWGMGMDWESEEVGSEKPASSEQVARVVAPALLDIREIQWLAVDLDNDGREELVAKRKFPQGIAYWILTEAHAAYRVVDPRARWQGWALTGLDELTSGEEFVFGRSAGKNYLVVVRDHPAAGYRGRGRVLSVFRLDSGKVRRVGTVEAVAGWQVSRGRVGDK